jgi:hypothetical protein
MFVAYDFLKNYILYYDYIQNKKLFNGGILTKNIEKALNMF